VNPTVALRLVNTKRLVTLAYCLHIQPRIPHTLHRSPKIPIDTFIDHRVNLNLKTTRSRTTAWFNAHQPGTRSTTRQVFTSYANDDDANDARDVRHVDGFDAAGVKQQQSDDGQETIGRGDEVRARHATRCDAWNGMARGRQPRAAGSLRDRWMDGWMDDDERRMTG
jgi:hypothetical protein